MKIPAYLVILLSWVISQAGFASGREQGNETHIWLSPRVVKAGTPVRIMAVSVSEPVTELLLIDPQGKTHALKTTAYTDGMPWRLTACIEPLGSGRYQIQAKAKDKLLACEEIFNGDHGGDESEWNEAYEAFYSAWIEQLFDAL